ncbi:MAG: EamA family transporter [Spongiibacteraceae bacterium]
MIQFSTGVLYALSAALLFGVSTPFAKLLLEHVSPVMLGGVLYLGSGIGLLVIRLLRDKCWVSPNLPKGEWPWLIGAIVFGGCLGPVLLMLGLAQTSGSSASLLLNVEAVLTAVIAWIIFKENADRRIVMGMFAIVLGGIIVSWPSALMEGTNNTWLGPIYIVGACICWAIDNNLTRKVSASDALFIAGSKGLAAGVVNCSIALLLGYQFPEFASFFTGTLLGFLGYGVSLVMFVLALRHLGTARTGAYFSTAPFLGAAVSIALLNEATSIPFWLAATCMAVGVWLHLTESHDHTHTHEPLEHNHPHRHDNHHQHDHVFDRDGNEPHTHFHQHVSITHKHPHYPDVHHRHEHVNPS